MNIVDAMKNHNLRLSIGNSWMYWDEDEEIWVVLSRKPGQRKNRTRYEGVDELQAIEKLVKEEG